MIQTTLVVRAKHIPLSPSLQRFACAIHKSPLLNVRFAFQIKKALKPAAERTSYPQPHVPPHADNDFLNGKEVRRRDPGGTVYIISSVWLVCLWGDRSFSRENFPKAGKKSRVVGVWMTFQLADISIYAAFSMIRILPILHSGQRVSDSDAAKVFLHTSHLTSVFIRSFSRMFSFIMFPPASELRMFQYGW
jgi:hypothetical protein